MWPSFLKHRTGPVGCACTDRDLKLVQLRSTATGQMRAVSATCHVPVEHSAGTDAWRSAATDSLRQALANSHFSGRDVVACMPDGQVQHHHLRLAPMPAHELDSAVRWRAAKELARPPGELQSAFLDVGEVFESGKRRHEVIAVTASASNAEAHARLLIGAGLTPMAIDAAFAALARCFTGTNHHRPQPMFVIEFGSSSSTLMIVQDGMPRFVRAIAGGWRQIMQQARASVNPDDRQDQAASRALDEAVTRQTLEAAHETVLCIHYLSEARQDQEPPQVGCVVGARSKEPTILETLNGACGIEFQPALDLVAPPLRSIARDLPSQTGGDDWLVPLGLGLHGIEHAVRGIAA